MMNRAGALAALLIIVTSAGAQPIKPPGSVSLTDFGAIAGGQALTTAAFEKAIAACSDSGGGTVYVPPGKYLTGTIVLKSHVTLNLANGATILGSQKGEDYLTVDDVWTVGAKIRAPLIYAEGAQDIAITGKGTIDGQGASWWAPILAAKARRARTSPPLEESQPGPQPTTRDLSGGNDRPQLIRFVLGAARFGTVHANPHLEDALVLPDGRLGIVDFGATRALAPARVDDGAAAVDALVARDGEAFGAALQRLGWLPAEHGPAALDLALHALAEHAEPGPSRLDSDAVCAARDRALARPDDLAALLVAGTLPPTDLWPARGVGQLFAVIARLGATGDWIALTRAALRDGWN